MAEMFVIVEMGNACLVTMRIWSISASQPSLELSVGSVQSHRISPTCVGNFEAETGATPGQEKMSWNIQSGEYSMCQGIFMFWGSASSWPEGKRFAKGERKWKVSWMEMWWKKFAAGTCFFWLLYVGNKKSWGKKIIKKSNVNSEN